jgi:5S rRNA maturation endonuclease (ribonuclease M5)
MSSGGTTTMIDYQSIRDRHPLPEYLKARGVQLRQSGSRWLGKCPLHNEQHGEAFVIEGDRWSCLGKCNLSYRDVVDFAMESDHLSREDALISLGAESVEYAPIKSTPKPEPVAPTPLTPEEISIRTRAASRLYSDRSLQSWLADHRSWKRETIEALTVEHSLGWLDEWTFAEEVPSVTAKDGKLVGRGGKEGRYGLYTVKNLVVFGYEYGIKIRYHRTGHPLDGGDDRRVQWLCGKPTLWRGHLDALARAETVLITEGETDALRWIDLGKCQKAGNLVIAAPSASTFRPEWGKALAGKKVIVSTDFDEAGRKAERKIAAALHPYATKITFHEIKQ